MDVVVIGAGIFGAWTALSLAQAGHKVTLLDREGPGNEHSSSAGESRIIRSAYGADGVYTEMARRSLRLWADFFREENQPDLFQKTGVLWMANSSEPGVSEARTIFEHLGIAHEWLDANAIARRHPQFAIQAETVALFEPDAGALLADRCIRAVMGATVRAGVRYETVQVNPSVQNSPRLSSIQTTDGRQFSADYFVFACGSWLPKLFPLLAKVIRPTRQDLFFFAAPESGTEFRPGNLPIWIDQTERKIAYGFPDLGNGVKLGFHQLGPDFDPDHRRAECTSEFVAEAADYLARRLPAMSEPRLRATHVCHYENTPNGDFLIDLHPGTDNVWLVGGGSGHGFKHAPAIAEYLTDVMSGASFREPRFSLGAKLSAASGRVL
jgi:sarcosine oxidase